MEIKDIKINHIYDIDCQSGMWAGFRVDEIDCDKRGVYLKCYKNLGLDSCTEINEALWSTYKVYISDIRDIFIDYNLPTIFNGAEKALSIIKKDIDYWIKKEYLPRVDTFMSYETMNIGTIIITHYGYKHWKLSLCNSNDYIKLISEDKIRELYEYGLNYKK